MIPDVKTTSHPSHTLSSSQTPDRLVPAGTWRTPGPWCPWRCQWLAVPRLSRIEGLVSTRDGDAGACSVGSKLGDVLWSQRQPTRLRLGIGGEQGHRALASTRDGKGFWGLESAAKVGFGIEGPGGSDCLGLEGGIGGRINKGGRACVPRHCIWGRCRDARGTVERAVNRRQLEAECQFKSQKLRQWEQTTHWRDCRGNGHSVAGGGPRIDALAHDGESKSALCRAAMVGSCGHAATTTAWPWQEANGRLLFRLSSSTIVNGAERWSDGRWVPRRPQRHSPKRLSPKYDGPDWHVHSTETAQGGRIRNGVPWERWARRLLHLHHTSNAWPTRGVIVDDGMCRPWA